MLVLFTVFGINQERYREWERLQAQIKISAQETLQVFKEAGLPVENIITIEVSKPLYGVPRSALSATLKLEKSFSVDALEYQDWRAARHTVEYQTDFCECNGIPYKGGLFSHGAVVIFINPPEENLEAQLKKILMDRYNLTKQTAQ